MIRSLWLGLVLLVFAHVAAAGAGVGWLYATDRLDQKRLERVYDMFELTIAEEQEQIDEAARLEAEAIEMAQQAARLESIAEGPVTLGERLGKQQIADELAVHRLERLQRETEDLRGQVNRLKSLLSREQKKLTEERQAFEAYQQEQAERLASEDFQLAVSMFESLKPKQGKSVIDEMMREGRMEEALDYLSVMQSRKAGAILNEFKGPADTRPLMELIQGLRHRGANDLLTNSGVAPQAL